MNPSEKDTLLQFMGQVYGETKKTDQMVVGQSPQLQPRSQQVRQQFEQVLKTPAQAQLNTPVHGQPAPAARVAPPVPVAPTQITPEQAQQELLQAQQKQVIVSEPTQVTVEQLNDPNQLEFNLAEPSKVDRVIELLEANNKLLVEIRDNTIKSKYNAKRAKNKKPQ
jgi:hypothetical protein